MAETIANGPLSLTPKETQSSEGLDVTSPQSKEKRLQKSRPLVPKASSESTRTVQEVSRRKQSKSRTGCVNCKTKRIKCDEAKPFCQQCARRRVTCEGYKKNIRWKAFGETKLTGSQPQKANLFIGKSPDACPQSPKSPLFNGFDQMVADDTGNGFAIFPAQTSSIQSPLSSPCGDPPTDALPAHSSPSSNRTRTEQLEVPNLEIGSADTRFDFHDDEIGALDPSLFSNQLPGLVNLDLLLPESGLETALSDQHSPELFVSPGLDIDVASTLEGQIDWQTFDPDAIDDPIDSKHTTGTELGQDLVETALQSPEINAILGISATQLDLSTSHPRTLHKLNFNPLYQQPHFESGNQEMLTHLFHHQTSTVLSIKEERINNPWRTLIWPIAKDCPALRHAMAAMTCLLLGKTQPQFRSMGMKHVQCSMQKLAAEMNSGSIRLDAAVATVISLGIAEAWDFQKSSTGIGHIKSAKVLVQRAIAKHRSSQLPIEEANRLRFLANTWIYLDVISRFTSADKDPSIDFDFINACNLLSPVSEPPQFDELMGCAATLFPTIGRVADLVGRVQKSGKRNSPTIISQAVELKQSIENWAPPTNLETLEESPSNVSDAVQTAEAFRWAALLLLRQAVPELPSSASLWDLAQHILVLLATVPLTSRTTIVQTFPLMVAGCEALEEEDRDWVRERWQLMSRRMISGIVNRCLEVTSEVWRRRDEHETQRPPKKTSDAQSRSISTIPLGNSFAMNKETSASYDTLNGLQLYIDPTNAVGNGGDLEQASLPKVQTHSTSFDFQQSDAFKKGVANVTKAAFVEYTVKGKFHWLGVMKDWKWEVMLG